MTSVFLRTTRHRATGLLALALVTAGVSGCEPLAYGDPVASGGIPGRDGVIYAVWVSTPTTESGDETTSSASFNFDPPLVYYVTLDGARYRCDSDCRAEVRAYENGQTPGTAMHEEEDNDDAGDVSPGL